MNILCIGGGPTGLYFALLMLLTTAIAGAYFANNLAVTWIFLEATTLCSAGIDYHRRTAQALGVSYDQLRAALRTLSKSHSGISASTFRRAPSISTAETPTFTRTCSPAPV